MARNKSPVDLLLSEVVKQAVTAVLQPLGFKKTHFSFHRRHGEAVQVVTLQMSQGNTWDEKVFYVNVGIAFDAICRLAEIEILEKPREVDCDDRGTRDRLAGLVPFAPAHWTVSESDDLTATVRGLRFFFRQLAVQLEQLDNIEAYRNHPWFDRWRPREESAKILYLLDDLEAARREISQICIRFADRTYPPTFASLCERLHLDRLRDLGPPANSQKDTAPHHVSRKPHHDASFILFPSPGISLGDAVDALKSRGLTATVEGDTATVSSTSEVRFALRRVEGEAIKQQSAWIGEGSKFADLGSCDARFEILTDDLTLALDEINALIEIQLTLQAATRGYLFNCWNGYLSSSE